jgi:hypothetical protein
MWLAEVAKTTDTFQSNDMKTFFPKEDSTVTEEQLSNIITYFDADSSKVVERSEMKQLFIDNKVKLARSFLEELKSSVRNANLKTLTAVSANIGETAYYVSGADQKETHERAAWYC